MRLTSIALASVAAACTTNADDVADSGWNFAKALAPPTSAEIAQADRAWDASRQQVLTGVEVIARTRLVVPDASYAVHLINYRLNGSKRCGAILVPEGSAVRTTIVDLSDVQWDYPPRDISRGAYISRILGERAPEAAIVLPCFRGMTVVVNDYSVSADGDRRDAWVGATNDAKAFLTVALEKFPNLPRQQVVAYGYSRGGGVALLMGQRDVRIKRVVAFAAPTDFFSAMARPGADWAAALKSAHRSRGFPEDSRERQYLDWFFAGAASEEEVRQRLVMSSAAYFLPRLPETQIHHGEDDQPVPVANAKIVSKWARHHPNNAVVVHIYEGDGHMVGSDAFEPARNFMIAGGHGAGSGS